MSGAVTAQAALLGVALATGCVAAQERAALIARGQEVFMEQGCHGCHTVGKMGTALAGDLSRIGAKYPEALLSQWLRDPAGQRPTAHMPRITLGDDEVRTLAAYLASLQ